MGIGLHLANWAKGVSHLNTRNYLIFFAIFLFALIIIGLTEDGRAANHSAADDELSYLPLMLKPEGEATPVPTETQTPLPPMPTNTAEPGSTPTTAPTATATSPAAPTASPTPTAEPLEETWLAAWMVNTENDTSAVFTGVSVDVSTVYTKTENGIDYQCITASGIPSYEVEITQQIIDQLNGRQKANSDFAVGNQTSATLGQIVSFGEDIGYDSSCNQATEDGYGYWPPGPACPTDQSKDQCFPLSPEPAVAEEDICATGLNDIGAWVNGVAVFSWTDGMSYNNGGVWQNDAYHFEINDLDIIPGHSANGNYHHHSNPWALGAQLGDVGDSHSPIYGFAADGYPIYGPWHADGELANSCWKARDYDSPASPTGCGVAGERSCVLVDNTDITQGTTAADSDGPTTSDSVSSLSGNVFVTTSGYYFEDYYYDPSCTTQGVAYLDEHNGHDHDGLGYHYHVTVVDNGDGTFTDVFPYYIGPNYAGQLLDGGIATCGGMGGGPGGGGPGGGPPGGGGGPP